MDPLALVVTAMVFASIVMFSYGVYLWFMMRYEMEEERFKRRLGLVYEEEVEFEEDDEALAGLLKEQAQDATMAFLGEYGERIETTIKASGAETTVNQVVTQMATAGLLTALVAVYVAGTPGLIGLAGAIIPLSMLQRKAKERSNALLQQMPDALELMSRAMQTGAGLSDGFRLASEEMPEPIAFEFGRVFEEVRFGKEWRDALNALIDRNPTVFDLRLFVSSVLLQRETGGNMIETLANIANTIRSRYVFDAKVAAMTAEARTSGFVLAGMPAGVILMIVLANAEYLDPLIYDPLGNAIIMLCVCMYGFGLYIMKIASQVEV